VIKLVPSDLLVGMRREVCLTTDEEEPGKEDLDGSTKKQLSKRWGPCRSWNVAEEEKVDEYVWKNPGEEEKFRRKRAAS